MNSTLKFTLVIIIIILGALYISPNINDRTWFGLWRFNQGMLIGAIIFYKKKEY